ncbi:hypothetical protein AB0L70_30395 [Kribbella sp. NPDC051952]|uniref:hypothetical protein n=1 Tax=Kribbella sp. NPDC051952 TaxID=3154851 RepID=UPI00341AB4D7
MTPRSAAQMHREAVRDAGANSDVPPQTGDNSGVSEAAMTARAQGTAAALQNAGPATSSGLSPDLQRTMNAATQPQTGQTRTGGSGDGAAPKTGQTGKARDKGAGPRSV